MNEHNFLAVRSFFYNNKQISQKFGNGNNLWPKHQSFLLFQNIYYIYTYSYRYAASITYYNTVEHISTKNGKRNGIFLHLDGPKIFCFYCLP